MDNKFYVSLDAARLLKEKGYNEKVDYMYDDGELVLIKTLTNEQIDRYYRTMHDGIEFYGAPTKSEAIDWLENKEVLISSHPITILREDGTTERNWRCHIVHQDGTWYTTNDLPTRLEAEDAAIIKACELL